MKESNGLGQAYNEEQAQRTAWLIAGYIRQTLTEKEHDELDDWVTASDANQRLFEELVNPKFIEKGLAEMAGTDSQAALDKIKLRLHFKPERPIKKKLITYGIAASLVILVGLFFLFILMDKKADPGKPGLTENTIQPGGNYAVLKLANGQTINLYDAKNGLIDSSGGSEVLKTADGQLSYEKEGKAGNEIHTLTTPAGGQYNILLADGSRVWLNASSSLTYPVTFSGKTREVTLTGEGYFEIANVSQHTAAGEEKIPFIVDVRGRRVEVLGTHFDINAYEDETTINTTLLEGKVRIGDEELSPGEQAQLDPNGKITILQNINTAEAVAWKNGQFQFKDALIEPIMRQVKRWYDAEVVYEGKVDFHFNATIYRKEPVEKLLHILEETNRVHFKIDGKKIIVKP
ncbi:MAG TPA: FecR domain-containing protein [Chitinophagaceae bacterium]|nr:FecR domain-containing protein [Chitinophagaceae bacterium]